MIKYRLKPKAGDCSCGMRSCGFWCWLRLFYYWRLFASLTARSNSKFISRFLPKLFFRLVVLVFLVATVLTGHASFVGKVKPFWPFFVSLAWTMAFFASGKLVLRRGFPKSQAEHSAASWPRIILVGLLVIVLFAEVATYNQLLKTLDAELAEIQNDAGHQGSKDMA